MTHSDLRKAVKFALQSVLSSAEDRDAALTAAEAEIIQLLSTSGIDADSAELLAVVREEIAMAKVTAH